MADKPTRVITDLADTSLIKDRITLRLEFDDEIWEFQGRRLSNYEWMRYEREEPPPAPPKKHVRSGVDWDYDHPDHRRKLTERIERISYKRIAACLSEIIPGATIDEKVEYLNNNLTQGVIVNIYQLLVQAHSEGEAVIERSHSFRRDGTATVEGDDEARDVPF